MSSVPTGTWTRKEAWSLLSRMLESSSIHRVGIFLHACITCKLRPSLCTLHAVEGVPACRRESSKQDPALGCPLFHCKWVVVVRFRKLHEKSRHSISSADVSECYCTVRRMKTQLVVQRHCCVPFFQMQMSDLCKLFQHCKAQAISCLQERKFIDCGDCDARTFYDHRGENERLEHCYFPDIISPSPCWSSQTRPCWRERDCLKGSRTNFGSAE